MGFFSSKEKEVQNLGSCFLCGTELNEKAGKCGVRLADENTICHICSMQKKLKVDKQSTKDSLLEQIKNNGFVTPDIFSPTTRIQKKGAAFGNSFPTGDSFIEIDEVRELILIPEVEVSLFSKDKRTEHIRKFKDLIDFELLNNGTKITDGNSLLGAAVGGAVFGGFGAIVGSGARSKSTTDVCKSLSIKLMFDDLKNPTEYIKIITSELKTNTDAYQQLYASAQECLSILTVILKKKQGKSTPSPAVETAGTSAVEEIKKYKELLDAGIITEDEFSAKKKQLLGI